MMRDAVRVYVSDNNGDWQELATNNSYRGNGFVDDELQDFDAAYRRPRRRTTRISTSTSRRS